MPEILEPRVLVTPQQITPADYLNIARRAFPMTQQLLQGSPTDAPAPVDACWYGPSTSPEMGAFATVQRGAGLDSWVGSVLQVVYGARVVYVYVIDFADLPSALGLARRAFMALARPSLDVITCRAAVIA